MGKIYFSIAIIVANVAFSTSLYFLQTSMDNLSNLEASFHIRFGPIKLVLVILTSFFYIFFYYVSFLQTVKFSCKFFQENR